MAEMELESISKDEVERLLSLESTPVVYTADKQWVKRFAEAIDDPNPLWVDEKYASKTEYGGNVIPPSFLCALRNDSLRGALMDMKTPLKRLVNASSELEFFEPIKVGDIITVTDKLVDIKEQVSNSKKRLVITNKVTYKNQDNKVVAIGTNTAFRF